MVKSLNKNGQTLIVFIILIPLIVFLFAFIVDSGLCIYEKVRTTETIKSILAQETTETKIKELLIKNDIPVDNLQITNSLDNTNVTNTISVQSIFGNIIGIKTYDIKINLNIKKNKGE